MRTKGELNDKTAKPKAHEHEASVPELSEEQRKAYEEIRGLLDGQEHETSVVWYEVGRIVMKTKAAPKYGKKAVAKIAKALGREESTLYDAGRVAEKWAPQRFAELANKRGKVRGNRLFWSHFVELAKDMKPKRRDSFIEDILREGWSVRDLKLAIKGPKVEDAPKGGQPVNVAKALRTFKAESETMLTKAACRGTSLFDVLKAQDEKLGTPNILELLRDTREIQLQAKQICEAQLTKFDKFIESSVELQAVIEGDIQGTSPKSKRTRGAK